MVDWIIVAIVTVGGLHQLIKYYVMFFEHGLPWVVSTLVLNSSILIVAASMLVAHYYHDWRHMLAAGVWSAVAIVELTMWLGLKRKHARR